MATKTAVPQRLFGDAVRAERLRQKISQEELAHRSGITTGYMSRVERGTVAASIETIAKIAGGLGLTGTQLFSKAGI